MTFLDKFKNVPYRFNRYIVEGKFPYSPFAKSAIEI